ncbi:MAG: hypothetical protein R2822_18520 [Spirosomataceae bacterium]
MSLSISLPSGFSIKVLPETTVNIYVTAPGYTDASANINDIKHDRVLAFEFAENKPSVVKIKVENVADNQPIENGTIKIQSKNTAQPQIIAWTKGG